MPRLSDAEQRILERNAVYAVYEGSYSVKDAAIAFPSVSKKLLSARVAMIPKGLEDTDSSLALTRACNNVCGLKESKPYTEEEQRKAVHEFNNTLFSKTKRDIEAEYGISKSTLKRLGQQLRAEAGRNPSDEKLKETAYSMRIKTSGPQPYVSKEENAIFHTIAKERGDCGEGSSRLAMRTDARLLVQAIGEGAVEAGLDPKKCERLMEAKCGAQWLTDSMKRAADLAPKADFRKASTVSHKRAAATALERNEIMFDKIEEMYAELFEAGILKTPHPKPEQVEAIDRPRRTQSPYPSCIIMICSASHNTNVVCTMQTTSCLPTNHT